MLRIFRNISKTILFFLVVSGCGKKSKSAVEENTISLFTVKNLPKETDKQKSYSLEVIPNSDVTVWLTLVGEDSGKPDFDCAKHTKPSDWSKVDGKSFEFSKVTEGKNAICGQARKDDKMMETRLVTRWIQDSLPPNPAVKGFPSKDDISKDLELTPVDARDWKSFQMTESDMDVECEAVGSSLEWTPWQSQLVIKLPAKSQGGMRFFCLRAQDGLGNVSDWFKTSWHEQTVPLPFGLSGLPNKGVLKQKSFTLQLTPEHKGVYFWLATHFGNCQMEQAQRVEVGSESVGVDVTFSKEGLNRFCISYSNDASGKNAVLGVYEFWVDTLGASNRLNGLPSFPFFNQNTASVSIDQGKYPGETFAIRNIDSAIACGSIMFGESDFQTSATLPFGLDGQKALCYQIKYQSGFIGDMQRLDFIKDTQEEAPVVRLKDGPNLIWAKLKSSILVESSGSVPYQISPKPQEMAVAVVEQSSMCPDVSGIGTLAGWTLTNLADFNHPSLYALLPGSYYKVCVSVRDLANNWSAVGMSQNVIFNFLPFQSPSDRMVDFPSDFSNPTQLSRVAMDTQGLKSGEKISYHLTRQVALTCPATPTTVPSLTDPCTPCPSTDKLVPGLIEAEWIQGKPQIDLTSDGLYRVCVVLQLSSKSEISIGQKEFRMVRDAVTLAPVVTFPVPEGSDTILVSGLSLAVKNPMVGNLPNELMVKYGYILFHADTFFELNTVCPDAGTLGELYFGSGPLPLLAASRSAELIDISTASLINAPAAKPWKKLCVVGVTAQNRFSPPTRRLWSVAQGQAGLPQTSVKVPMLEGNIVNDLTKQRAIPFANLEIQGARRYSYVLRQGDIVCPGPTSTNYPTTLINGYEKLDITLNQLKNVGGASGKKTLCVRGKNDSNPNAVVYKLSWTQLYTFEPVNANLLPINGNSTEKITFKLQHTALRQTSNQNPKVDILFNITSGASPFSDPNYCSSKANPLLDIGNLNRVPFLSSPSTVAPLAMPDVLYDGNLTDVQTQGKIRTFDATIPSGAPNKVLCVWGRDQVGNFLDVYQLSWTQAN